jgi:hypothetical protein
MALEKGAGILYNESKSTGVCEKSEKGTIKQTEISESMP